MAKINARWLPAISTGPTYLDLSGAPLCIVGFDSGDSAVVDGGEPEVWE